MDAWRPQRHRACFESCGGASGRHLLVPVRSLYMLLRTMNFAIQLSNYRAFQKRDGYKAWTQPSPSR